MEVKELLAQLSVAQLKELKTILPRELERRIRKDQGQALKELRAKAQQFGARIVLTNEKSNRAAMYQHPEDSSLTWTGAGRKPKWLISWVENGGNIEDTRVAQ